MKDNYCDDCGTHKASHIGTWIEEVLDRILPSDPANKMPSGVSRAIDATIERVLLMLCLASLEDVFTPHDIALRSTRFIEEGKKRGAKFQAIKGPFGFTGNFRMYYNNRLIRFEGLPQFPINTGNIDDKKASKEILSRADYPVPKGRAFPFWKKGEALSYAKDLGFPLVVKPRAGSVARHVTPNITSFAKLLSAVDKAYQYSPSIIIEEHIPGNVYRATVVNYEKVFCVRQVPANVVGDGVHTIQNLIEQKNAHPARGPRGSRAHTLFHIPITDDTIKLLKTEGYTLQSIPKAGQTVYLQENPFFRLGADLEEVTSGVHPDNTLLFQDVAKVFKAPVVGVDFVAANIADSWKAQKCGILELNSLPCIEMHELPSHGDPQNVSAALFDMLDEKYFKSN